jgi:NADPH:quinone reductase-like Zn-dependent oxidoreductase
MPKAVQYERFGDPSVLEVVEVPEVHASEDRVRVVVRAAGLNPFDFKMRSGLVPIADPKFPRGIGGDFAGVVDEVGEGAVYFDGDPVRVGDEVLGWGDRVMREQLVVPATNLARRPPALAWEAAGGLSIAAQTANAAVDTLDIHDGDLVLESAAAGSVGFFSSQLAMLRGARVIGTSSEANFALLESAGIIPVAYGPGLAVRVRAVAPGPVTAVQDNYGREAIDAGIELGVPKGRITTIVDRAAAQELGLAPFGPYERSAEVLQHYAGLVADGTIRMPIEATFPLDGVRDAFALLESRHLGGKVILLPQG